jgi:L-asparaginase II
MTLTLAVQAFRGSILESRHECQAAVCDVEGRLHAGTNDPWLVTTFRSSAKPFQLLPLVERGHAERWGFDDEQIAVMAASHTGSAYHRGLVAGILERIGLDASHLACGFHDPMDPDSLAEVRANAGLRSSMYNNCSGQHAGMLALARSEGWSVEGYERADHPVQQLLRRVVADVCGVGAPDLATATDDCGAVVFAAPLAVMARGYARFAAAAAEGEARERSLHRVRTAMSSYPRAVGGAGRFSTQLMEITRGRVIAKGGAEGLECMGDPGRSLGVAVKCVDGAGRAVAPAAVALLEHMGLLSESERSQLATLRAPVLRNHAGLEVGRLEATVGALSPSV